MNGRMNGLDREGFAEDETKQQGERKFHTLRGCRATQSSGPTPRKLPRVEIEPLTPRRPFSSLTSAHVLLVETFTILSVFSECELFWPCEATSSTDYLSLNSTSSNVTIV